VSELVRERERERETDRRTDRQTDRHGKSERGDRIDVIPPPP